jgi:hypothetical protein
MSHLGFMDVPVNNQNESRAARQCDVARRAEFSKNEIMTHEHTRETVMSEDCLTSVQSMLRALPYDEIKSAWQRVATATA